MYQDKQNKNLFEGNSSLASKGEDVKRPGKAAAPTNWVEGNMKVIKETAGRPALLPKDASVKTQEGISWLVFPPSPGSAPAICLLAPLPCNCWLPPTVISLYRSPVSVLV